MIHKRVLSKIVPRCLLMLIGVCLVSTTQAHPHFDNSKPQDDLSQSLVFGGGSESGTFLSDVIAKVRRAFGMEGIELVHRDLPLNRSTMMAASGKIDGLYVRLGLQGDEYPSLRKVDVPVYIGKAWIWVLKDGACPSSIEALKDYTTVNILGYDSYNRIPQIQASPKVQAKDLVSSFRMLKAGRVEYLGLYKTVSLFFQKEMNIELKSCFNEPLIELQYYTFLHRRHQHLIPKLEPHYRELFPN